MASKLYYEIGRPSAYSTLKQLKTAVGKQSKKKQKPSEIKALLEPQDAYTLHRPVRKRFSEIPTP
jgi:hypothetical protein